MTTQIDDITANADVQAAAAKELADKVSAAKATPAFQGAGYLLRQCGLDAIDRPMTVAEIDARISAAATPMPPRSRMELKAALDRVGLIKREA